MHTYNGVLTILGLGLAFFCILCFCRGQAYCSVISVCVHSTWKGRPWNDLYCVGWDVKLYSLTHFCV